MAKTLKTSAWSKGALVIFFAISLVAVLDVFRNARSLRPIADDYAAGNNIIIRGLGGYISNDYLNFSGELARVVADAVLVGIPVSSLPWSLSSLSTFIVASLVVGLAVLTTWAISRSGKKSLEKWLWLALPTAVLAWWAYWWAALTTPHDVSARALPEAITHWQIINSSYVVLPALVISLFLMLMHWQTKNVTKQWWRIGGIFAVGLLAGLTGPVFGLTVAIGILSIYAALVFQHKTRRLRPPSWVVAAFVGVLVGVAITQASPGTRSRAPLFRGGEGMVPFTPGNLLNWTIPAALYEWADRLANVGTLVVLLLTIGVGFLATSSGLNTQPRQLLALGTGLLLFSLVYSIANRLSEAFVYPAFWHQVGFSTILFLAIAIYGFLLGSVASRSNQAVAATLIIASLVVGILWALSSERLLVGSINDRYSAWLMGPAPLNGIPDIEQVGGGFERFWVVLAEFRGDAPDRGVK